MKPSIQALEANVFSRQPILCVLIRFGTNDERQSEGAGSLYRTRQTNHYWRHPFALYLRSECGWGSREIQLVLRHKDIGATTAQYFEPKSPSECVF